MWLKLYEDVLVCGTGSTTSFQHGMAAWYGHVGAFFSHQSCALCIVSTLHGTP